MKPYPGFTHELAYWNDNTYVIGIDEVGRGCLAGPVFVGGVCYPFLDLFRQKEVKKLKIHDSKLCTAKKRQNLAPEIKNRVVCWKTASSSVEDINALGIVPAIEKAATLIIRTIRDQLPSNARFIVFTDTLPIKSLRKNRKIQQIAIPQADANTITVASASILAKVERDELMTELHTLFPHYDWCNNKGYATKTHQQSIRTHGISPQHRRLFVRKVLLTSL